MKKVLPFSVFFLLLLIKSLRTRILLLLRWRRILAWGWSLVVLIMWLLIHIISFLRNAFVVSFQLETSSLTVSWFTTVKANTLFTCLWRILLLFATLIERAKLHRDGVRVTIFPRMECTLLWSILDALMVILKKLSTFSSRGEVKSYFCAFCSHYRVCYIGRLVE